MTSLSVGVSSKLASRLADLASAGKLAPGAVVEAAAVVVAARHLGRAPITVQLDAGDGAPRTRTVQLDPGLSGPALAAQLAGAAAAPPGEACDAFITLRGFARGGDRPGPAPAPRADDAIELTVAARDGALEVSAAASRRGDAWTAARLAEQLACALGAVAAEPERPAADLDLLPAADRELLARWNATASADRAATTVHALFARAAAARPDAPAVLMGDLAWSYGALERRAHQLAHHLLAAGVQRGQIVGVCLERSPEVLAVLLAILEVGAAYLPLDPAYPRDRLTFMLTDTGAPVIVTAAALAGALPEVPGARRLLLDVEAALVAAAPVTAPAAAAEVQPDDLAYVMYTSGSTGVPKGVEVRHRSIVRLVRDVDYATLGPDRTLLHAAPLAFDASTFEIWGALLNGGRCVVHPEALPTARGLGESIRRHGVTTAWLTAALFNEVVDEDVRQLAGLSELLTGGEALSVAHVRRAQEALPGAQLVNGYGPTESTTFTTCHRIPRPLPADWRAVPIGKPIRDTQCHVLQGTALAPLGAAGELCIGGLGLARGYHRRPELTAERFVPDPRAPGNVLYRTGDLVRWNDGVIEFLGRIDDQVKIRGFRIELGEVQAALAHHPAVLRCAVVAREDRPGQKRLVAYAVAREGAAEAAGAELRAFLRERLPEHMVPAAFVWLPSLPVNANGKLDRRALPAPATDRPDLGTEYVAPSSELERRLAALFAEVLGLDRVGARDGFFDLGGNSLLALRTVARLQQAGLELSVTDLFTHTSPEALARRLGAGSAPAAPVRPAARAAARGGRGDVAVVGMAGRFPGADSVEELWRLVCEGLDAVSTFTDDELDPSIPAALRGDPAYVKARGIVRDCDRFDAAFFGVSPKDAEMLDPQQRLLMEVAWEALERSGHVPESFPGPIGLFAGKYFDFYWDEVVRTRPDLVEQLGDLNARIDNDKHFVATRVAHKLDLSGPALSVHSACSTSLVASALAVQSLRAGECDMALAGGASITVPVKSGYLYQEGSMLSPDGRCRPFDADASGTTFSDGVAVVVLRRLEDALADGDTVYAVIRGASVNNDGAQRASFTAPSVTGQAAVITRALADAGVEARSISYVETHGTATPLGDPIEVESLTRAFRATTADRGFCALGSVKSNVGHLVIAAGATGLIKTALALHHRLLPPTAHFKRPNPRIDFAGSPFHVQARLEPWPGGEAPRRAGVSAFGVGGTNAHLVLEEAPAAPAPSPGRPGQLLVLSARTATALDEASRRLREHLEAHPEATLADVAFTLQAGRQHFAHRRFLAARDVADAVAGLAAGARRMPGRHLTQGAPGVVFMFPGQGSQHVDMGKTLYATEPVFRAAVDFCAEAVRDLLGRDLRELLYPGADPEAAAASLKQTSITQPALFTISYALARLWQSWGVQPAAMIGHSVGEFVAAALAGVLDPRDAVRLVAARGALMQAMPPGGMLSVSQGAATLADRLRAYPELAVASDNAPQLCVVAGPTPAVERLQAELTAAGVGCRPLLTSHAFHSAMMEPAVAPFAELVAQVKLSPPAVPFVSTRTGTWITAAQATDPAYWAGHLRATVRFSDGVRTLLEEKGRVLLEVGPRATLTALSRRQAPDAARQPIVASQGDTAEGGADRAALLAAAGQLWLWGARIDWSALHAGERRRRVVLPTYPFERKRFWIERGHAPAAALPAPAPQPAAVALAVAPPVTAPAAVPLTLAAPPVPQEAVVSAPAPSANLDRRIDELRQLFEEVTGLELAGADPSACFVDLGLDSLFLTQAALQVQRQFGVKVTFRQLMESLNSLSALAEHIQAEKPDAPAPAAAAPAPAPLAAAPAAAPAHAPAAFAPPPAFAMLGAVPAAAPVDGAALSGLPQVIAQQLQLMAQQLAMLQGAGVALPAPAVAAPRPAVAPPAPVAPAPAPRANGVQAAAPAAAADGEEAAVQKYDVKKAFGAIARITTSGHSLTPTQQARLEALTRRYNARTQESKRLTQLHRPYLADPRVVTGFKPTTKELTYQVIIQRSAGSRLWDVDGNEYVDALCGFGSCFFGWQPPFVTEAVKRQLDTGHEIGPMTPLAGEVAKLLCEVTGFDRAGFCNTGSEAVMGTMRIARTVTGRTTIVTFNGAYHGIFDEVIVRGTKKLKAIPAAPGIMPNTAQNVLVLDYGTPESLEIIRGRADELAAVLVEPVQSRRPDFQPREFLHEVRKITEGSGSALIFDEVVNGFRTCPGGAQEFFGIRADLASYGKVVGGGFPIGVIAGRRRWADALDGGFWQFGDDSVPTVGPTYFAGTFCRHPLALAAAKAVLTHLKEQGPALQQGMNERTAQMVAQLNACCEASGAPIKVKQFSSLWKIFFTEEHPLQDLLFVCMRDRGVHIMDGFPCFLTTAHSAADVDTIVRVFRESLTEMQESGFLPGKPARPAVDPATPPAPGARLGRDPAGQPAWYVPDPERPGKYLQLEVK